MDLRDQVKPELHSQTNQAYIVRPYLNKQKGESVRRWPGKPPVAKLLTEFRTPEPNTNK